MDIEELDSLGKNRAKKLKDEGYSTVESLSTASIRDLSEVQGIGDALAKSLWKQANKIVSPDKYMTAKEKMEQEKKLVKLTTGSQELNEMLGGGVESGHITEFAGGYGVGKSQLSHQLAVNAFLPEEQGGLVRSDEEEFEVLFMDTEDGFKARRITGMVDHLGLDLDYVQKHILLSQVYTSDHQVLLVNEADRVIKENNVKVMIVDSLINHFRAEYIGRESLAERQQKLNSHLRKLKGYAKSFNIIMVVTNQAVSKPDFFGGDTPTGGNILAHASQTRILLRRPSTMKSKRIARLIESSYLPAREARFKITERGIEDVGGG